jgi:HK97 gp10 family phage protein
MSGVEGLADLRKALEALPDKLARRYLRAALRRGGLVYQKQAQSRVPVKSGALRDSIRVSTQLRRGEVFATIKAGRTRRAKGKNGVLKGDRAPFYAHFVEFGTQAHRIKPRDRKSLFLAGVFREIVDHPGASARPFMRPAFDTGTEEAVKVIADSLRAALRAGGLK